MTIIVSPIVPPPAPGQTSSAQVFTKDLGSAQFVVDCTSLLGTGETLTVVATGTPSPQTTSPLTQTGSGTINTGSKGFTITVNGGEDGMTYGIPYTCTTSSSRMFNVTAAILTQLDLNVPYTTKNPYAFQSLVGSIEAGDAAIGKTVFVVDAGTDLSSGYVLWDMLDQAGTTYASGNAYEFRVSQGTFATVAEATAVISCPSTVPPSLAQQSYQIRWTLVLNGAPAQHAFENLTVLGAMSVPLGADTTVELVGDLCAVSLVVDRPYPEVGFEVYSGNTKLVSYVPAPQNRRVSSGWYYTGTIDTSSLAASLDPYSILWKYKDTSVPTPFRETGRLFLANPSILSAVEDVQSCIMKARTTIDGFADTLFDPATVLTWLRRGRDMFNAAGGMPTEFNMTDATSSVREFWLRYSEVGALRAQYLAEGEKAFQFQGQAISLDVDRTQYYETLATNILQEIDQQVQTLKKNMQIKGINGGTGNMSGISQGAIGALGCVGINVNAISPNYPIFRPNLR